ncbi:L-serine dehydratase [Serinibacter salmoneus]|uniref:L-serine dehydratase n=1 Tax=Serinibacter salmoneus TaxID=556530 RepID=A0A2A9D2Z0_9MICO|nr:L-serine dehydratase [Serinibacter salmoneus]
MVTLPSVLDLFRIGIGPSSSHTVGPMRAAAQFVDELGADCARVDALRVELCGSLAATGIGHGTLPAVLVGLEGCRPEEIRAPELAERLARIEETEHVRLPGGTEVALCSRDIVMSPRTLRPRHTNALTLRALSQGEVLLERTYYSVGGGFVVRDDETTQEEETTLPLAYSSAAELLALCAREHLGIAEVTWRNEISRHPSRDVRAEILAIRDAMDECIAAGISHPGELPGGLRVRRRAPSWHERLQEEDPERSGEFAQEWVNLVALAVNEENAAGGRVVTAPTNGAAGIIPAVLYYAEHYTRVGRSSDRDDIAVPFLLTAAAIGALYKTRASISGAEVGCQGEVGSASSMAAGALAAILGGTPEQVENAAEIAMEHNLGLTCDPVGGLVQIPCIERNAIAAGKAINAARMAMRGDGTHRVSLDTVIETMRRTGEDMSEKYKETALGGLAVNVVEC